MSVKTMKSSGKNLKVFYPDLQSFPWVGNGRERSGTDGNGRECFGVENNLKIFAGTGLLFFRTGLKLFHRQQI